MVKDCFQKDKGFAGEPDLSLNSEGPEHCAASCRFILTCHCWTYDPKTQICHKFYNVSTCLESLSNCTGCISGDQDCANYSKNTQNLSMKYL